MASYPDRPVRRYRVQGRHGIDRHARASLEFHHMTDSTFRVADLAGAGGALRAGGERVPTWITKEAGNRRLPFEAERLQRSIDAVHAEFPQLDVSDYRRVVQAMVERKPSISADDLVDLLIREAESRVDLVAPEWEQFAARIYLHACTSAPAATASTTSA